MLCPNCGADSGDTSRFCSSCGTPVVRTREADPFVGRLVDGKYRVEALLGEGGMGRVYRARQLTLDKPVVLKLLHHSLQSDPTTVVRFEREARAASRLNHPNVISILDFAQAREDGTLYIAMELVAGTDLHHVLAHEWPLPEARILRIVSQVLSALGEAHGVGVIHRDLKPENIMLEQRRGEPDFVKVLDFGIAKIQDATGEDGRALTRAGHVFGTPEYVSPEQARGAPLDARSDLYAVGVILYQLVTGLLPFESDSPLGFATKHLTELPPAPSQRRAGVRVSPGLERLIQRALEKDPKDRPQSAESFRQELLALDGSASVGAGLAAAAASVPSAAPILLTPDAAAPAANRAEVRGGRTRTSGAGGAGLLGVKLLTGGLVLASLGLAAKSVLSSTPATSVPSAPVAQPAGPGTGEATAPPLFEMEVPSDRRAPEEAFRRMRDGDVAFQVGRLEQAGALYREAFERDPSPELSLKLGEVAWHQNQVAEARGWWRRHLRDHPDSRARRYIEEMFPELREGNAQP
ncbi:MAG: protein kinase [Myxococcaceae bacterium]|nr:protein kinase [Myxococcaceae bacterium]MCI0673434.1 protein kinase [Myxococcaceae bacterium]